MQHLLVMWTGSSSHRWREWPRDAVRGRYHSAEESHPLYWHLQNRASSSQPHHECGEWVALSHPLAPHYGGSFFSTRSSSLPHMGRWACASLVSCSALLHLLPCGIRSAILWKVRDDFNDNSFRIPGAFKYGEDAVGYLRVEVTDSGVGLSEDEQARVFGEFAQFDRNELQGGGIIVYPFRFWSTSFQHCLIAGGFGLGLWISRHIVHMHQVGQGVLSGMNCYLASHHSFRRGVWASLLQVAASDPLSSSRCQCTGRISVRPMMISCCCSRVVPGHTQHLWSLCHWTIIRCHCPTIPAKHCHTML